MKTFDEMVGSITEKTGMNEFYVEGFLESSGVPELLEVNKRMMSALQLIAKAENSEQALEYVRGIARAKIGNVEGGEA